MNSSGGRLGACLLVWLGVCVAQAGALDVAVTVDVPPGAAPTAENVTIAPLPAGKELAVVLYVDWGHRLAKDALPLAEAFHQAGWRGTFFLAGAKDIAQVAPKLEALGQEVATNLFSGGISAYRDEMFSYSPQDILNAIGPLRSELNAVLKRPVVTQLVRGHGVPHRDRIRAMGYLEATHWYRHYVFHGRDRKTEDRLCSGDRKEIPALRVSKLDESAFQQAEEKKAIALILGRGGQAYTGDYKGFLTRHGRKQEYWYATLGEFASSVYLRRNAKVSAVSVEGDKASITLALADGFNPLFLRSPLSLDVAGKVVDVPADAVLGGELRPEVALSPRVIYLPGETKLNVDLGSLSHGGATVKSASVQPVEGFDVGQPQWQGARAGVSFAVSSNDKAGPHSFGFVPFVVKVETEQGKVRRTLLAAAELEVRPALRVDVYPYDGVPLAPKGSQTFMLTVDNIRAGKGRGNWRNLRPKFEKFILPPEGPARGTITFPESDAFNVEADKLHLELAAGGERKVFYVTVTNTAATKTPYTLLPQIRLPGQARPLVLPFAGTQVYCVAKLGAPALDEKGLLMYASWDNDKVDLPHADRARGRKEAYRGAMGYITYGAGVLGRCALHKTTCLLDPYLNFNEAEGTMMFWLRDDPGQKKPLRRDMRERLFAVGTQHPAQNVDTSQMFLGLHGRGYLIGRMMTVGPTYHEVRAPFKKTQQWQHVALCWSCPKKFMRILVDGELRGELADDGKTWYPIPVRVWPERYGDFMVPLSDDHGTYTSTMRDEFYLYNRPLSAEEIREYIKQVNAKRSSTKESRP